MGLMESGLGLERAHMGIFTELGMLYAKFKCAPGFWRRRGGGGGGGRRVVVVGCAGRAW